MPGEPPAPGSPLLGAFSVATQGYAPEPPMVKLQVIEQSIMSQYELLGRSWGAS